MTGRQSRVAHWVRPCTSVWQHVVVEQDIASVRGRACLIDTRGQEKRGGGDERGQAASGSAVATTVVEWDGRATWTAM